MARNIMAASKVGRNNLVFCNLDSWLKGFTTVFLGFQIDWCFSMIGVCLQSPIIW